MSADRVRFEEQISQKLIALGCTKIAQLDDYNSLWQTAWGFVITVPDFGEEDKCPSAMWFEVLADIERTRPPK